jgi:hypothetical protein
MHAGAKCRRTQPCFGRILRTSTIKPGNRKDHKLAKPNYQYEKRQKDLAKKKKQEEKRLRKLEKAAPPAADNPDQTSPPVPAPDQGETA